MTFTEQHRNWQGLAEVDPLWAVLSEPDKRGKKWDVEEFYETGRREVHELMETLKGLGLPERQKIALDLGCGPGRITHALAEHFQEVVGYDISEEMLRLAAESAGEREIFTLNETDDLDPFSTAVFDFIYCSRVLQHIDAERIGEYLAEMVRVLAPGGVLFCQMLSHPTGWEGTRESGPDPSWGNGETPRYTVASVEVDAMAGIFREMGLIIHQVRLVEGGRGQSIFSYDFIVQKR